MCRRTIVFSLIRGGNYSEKCVTKFQVPLHMQDYLLFKKYKWSEKFLQDCAQIELEEERFNRFIDNLDKQKVFPRSLSEVP